VITEIEWADVVGPWGGSGIQQVGAYLLAALTGWMGCRLREGATRDKAARAAARELVADISTLRIKMGRARSREERHIVVIRWRSSWELAEVRIRAAEPKAADDVAAKGRSLYADLLNAQIRGRPWPSRRFGRDSAEPLEKAAREIAAYCCGRKWRRRQRLGR
jgi:hypothetical protein